jgi:molecular chaperone IbpA
MTMQLRTINPADLAQISRALVGFDQYFNNPRLPNSNYPPHNIVKFSDSAYAIEVAVAGFSKEEITVEVDQDQLVVRGTQKVSEETTKEYLHKGLASRDFEQTWTLAEYMEVKDAEVKDGMLIINIQRIIPESLKPRPKSFIALLNSYLSSERLLLSSIILNYLYNPMKPLAPRLISFARKASAISSGERAAPFPP